MSPPWLRVQAETIPAELRELGWVLWRAEPRGKGKAGKVPYTVADPLERASSTDPATWGTFNDAVEAYASLVDLPADPRCGSIAGIGCVLTRDAHVTCIDLDRVLVPDGQLDTRAWTILERCNSWTEISPSVTGLHIFLEGTVARALKGEQLEVYSSGRYICVTGHQWPDTPRGLTNQQGYLDHLVRIDEANSPRRAPYTGRSAPPPDDLAGALLAKLQTWGVSVLRLKQWNGGYLAELRQCPWHREHTTGEGGAAVMIHASGALDFSCLHAHCGGRTWRDFRTTMEQAR